MATYYPLTWGNLPTWLANRFGKNFETAMDEFIHSGDFSANIPLLMRQMAEYFIKFKPDYDDNLYVKLLRELPSINGITFSTLNYDVLFENAAEKNGVGISCFQEEKDKIFFLKLHGSSNFIPAGDNRIMGTRFEGTIRFEIPLKCATVEEVISFCSRPGNAIYPAMCLFAPEKKAQIGHEKILKIQEIWRTRILDAERILTIGFRPYPPDKHIYDPLSETNAIISYIGSKKRYDEWVTSNRVRGVTSYLGYHWGDCFDSSMSFLIE